MSWEVPQHHLIAFADPVGNEAARNVDRARRHLDGERAAAIAACIHADPLATARTISRRLGNVSRAQVQRELSGLRAECE